jgi:hypothetical protein
MEKKNWTGTANGTTSNAFDVNNNEAQSSNFYGRTYNEEVPFTQTNFAVYQDILNKRNEMLNSIKSTK